MRAVKYIVLLVGLLSGLVSCDLEKDIEVELPFYKPEIVVECYLETHQPYRLTVMESSPFLAPPEPVLLTDAKAVITRNGRPEVLRSEVEYNKEKDKFHTHSTNFGFRHRVGDVFTLSVTDKQGRQVTGSSTVLPTVLIDTVEYRYNDRGKAFIVAKFKDNGATEDYYRFSVHKRSIKRSPEVDYSSPDNLNNGKDFAFGTGFDFEKDDTVFVTLYHLEKQYYDFISSVDAAKDANGNPFAQPSSIKSTVQGGLGVFTTLVYDRKRIILK